jgi:hypothetical protein
LELGRRTVSQRVLCPRYITFRRPTRRTDNNNLYLYIYRFSLIFLLCASLCIYRMIFLSMLHSPSYFHYSFFFRFLNNEKYLCTYYKIILFNIWICCTYYSMVILTFVFKMESPFFNENNYFSVNCWYQIWFQFFRSNFCLLKQFDRTLQINATKYS